MKTVLFVGDSITDAGRCLTDDHFLGYGYATMTAGKINGNKSVDIYARIKRDVINLKPDILTILCGVNDVWHELDFADGTSADKYEHVYDMLIREIRYVLPKTQIVIMEPYVVKGSGTEAYYEQFRCDIENRAAVSRKIAEKYDLPFVPLQKEMDTFAACTSSQDVLIDGVHPTYVGHELISRALYAVLKKLL